MARNRRKRGSALPVALLALLLVGGAGWWLRDAIPWPWAEEAPLVVSPEAADAAEAKLALVEQGEEVRLSDVELTSLLRYRLRDRIPGDLYEPAVRLEGDQVRVTGRIPADRIPNVDGLGPARDFLPDTADVEVMGGLRTLEPGRAALRVRSVSFARFPVPEQVYGDALERLGRRDEPGLEPYEYPLRLPAGVASARVEEGLLVLSPAP